MSDRRIFLKSLSSLPLSVVLANPRISRAVSAGLQDVEAKLADGRTIKGALAEPQGQATGGILLIHEWWGLNDQIKSVAAEFAKQGYVALACDLYQGKVAEAGDRDTARSLMKGVDPGMATETCEVWIESLRKHSKSTGKVATIGWCFGGGWSLNASIATPVEATIVYYGNVAKLADQLEDLEGPVLGQFATEDNWINEEMVGAFETEMDKAGKAYITYWYEAQHGFANPTSARYDRDDAALAWQRTLEFLKDNLG